MAGGLVDGSRRLGDIMRVLASFILRGYSQAILAVVAAAVLALVFPPVSLISGAALALVTLRHGARFGMLVMAGAVLFVSALAWFSLGSAFAGLSFLGILWLPCWLTAVVLRESRSLALANLLAGALGIVGVVLAYVFLGDVTTWWREQLLVIFEPAIQEGSVLTDRAAVETVLADIARLMTGILAAGMAINTLLCLYLARAWQAMLFNPGGFRSEFHELRMGRGVALGSLAIILVSLLPLGGIKQLADEVLIVVLALYVVQGLALVHGVLAKRRMHVAWLIGVYLLAFFILPQLMVLIAVMGLIDSWIDFRRRVAEKPAST